MTDVEIAVADMADDWREEKGSCDVLLGFDDAFGQPRNWHADIGRPDLCAWAQRPIGINDVMTRPP